MHDSNAAPVSDIVGEGFVAEMEASRRTEGLHTVFSKEDLQRLQSDIADTIRPSHSTGPPARIGTKAQGKLKADQWKAAIDFELPVFLMKYWYTSDMVDLGSIDRAKHDLALNTMYLACAIRQGVTYQTSERHVQAYAAYMLTYLKDLRRIRPDLSLLPSHHNAMHIPAFLLRFGPMPGWWMFPFERVIGLLQKVKTNGKIGKAVIVGLRAELTSLYIFRPD